MARRLGAAITGDYGRKTALTGTYCACMHAVPSQASKPRSRSRSSTVRNPHTIVPVNVPSFVGTSPIEELTVQQITEQPGGNQPAGAVSGNVPS